MTAKEIADDVQQTFEQVSNSYRKLLEERIIKFAQMEAKPIKQVCEHHWRRNITIGEPIVTCIHCGKTDTKQTCR